MKIVYNVTVIIDHSVHEEWLGWMKSTHIPNVMATGFFESYQMQKIMESTNPDGVTYAIQYLLPNKEALDRYQKEEAPKLQEEHTSKYQGKFGAFRTIMELIEKG